MSCGNGPLSQLTLTELLPSSRQRDATSLKEGGLIKEGSSRFLERISRRESLLARQIQVYRFHSIIAVPETPSPGKLAVSVFLWCKAKDNFFLSVTPAGMRRLCFTPAYAPH